MLKQISHIGIAIKNLEQAMDFFRSAFHVEAFAPIIRRRHLGQHG